MATPKLSIRGLRRSDMDAFRHLCETREELDHSAAALRASVVEHVAFENPESDGQPTYFVATRDDEIMAHLGRMPTRFCVNGQLEPGSYFHDLYVHPDIRNVGAQGFFLSMQLYAAAEQASQGFVAMIWTNEINISLQQARKYDQMWTPRLVKLLTADELVEKRFPGWLHPVVKPAANTILRVADMTRRASQSSTVEIKAVARFDAEFDLIAEELLATGVVTPYKTSDYLNWKYTDRPGVTTSNIVACDADGLILGYAVITEPDVDYNTSSLAEFVVPGRDSNTMSLLIDAAARKARLMGAHRFAAVATEPTGSAALHSKLFLSRGADYPLFLAQPDRSKHADQLGTVSNWHMSMGDSEGPF